MWIYNELELKQEDIPDDALGFIYKITNTINGNWYIGKKMLTKAAYKQINGKRKKIRKESDWVDYWSSSPSLQTIMTEIGKENFKREILLFVNTKAALSYSEEYCLFSTGALFDPKCYNGNIRAKIMRSWFNKTPDLHVTLKNLKM